MNRAPLIGGIFAGSKERRNVKQSRFVVAADSHRSVRALHFAEDRLAEVLRFRRARISAEERAANAQIENNTPSRAQVRLENGSCASRIGREPLLNFFALRRGWQTASVAECVVRESWMNRRKLFERFPRGSLADRDIRIAWDERFAMRGVCDADGEPHPNERIEDADFSFLERKGFVIADDDGARRLQRVFLAEHRVGGGNCDLGDSEAVMHVSEINHADYFSRLRPRRTNQDVVIVGVAMDDAAAQRGQCRTNVRFVQREELFDECAPTGITNVMQMVSNPVGASEVPFQFPLGGWMRKICEGGIHFAEKLAAVMQQLQSVRVYFCENRARNIREHPEEALRSIGQDRDRERVGVRRWANARQRKLGRALGQMVKCLALHLDEGLLPRGMYDFQDKLASVDRCEMEIVVVLAGKRPGGGIEAENLAR